MKKPLQLSFTTLLVLHSVLQLQMHHLDPDSNTSYSPHVTFLLTDLPSSNPMANICRIPGSPFSQLRLKLLT